MKDIRPAPKRPQQGRVPMPAEDELYDVTRGVSKKPRFTGSTVGVAKVPTKPARPLFAKRAVPKGKRPKEQRVKMRLGQKERMVVGILLLVVLIVAGLAALLFLPRADIQLVLRTAPLLVDEELTVRAQDTGAANVIPGTAFFREVTVHGSIPVISTEVVGTAATGTVQLVNRTVEEQRIKERSRLVTEGGTLFYMQAPAFVPAGSDGAPSRVSVGVEAAESGETGNVEPQRLNFAALDESAQSVLYAEVTQALTGGTGEEVHVVKDEDIERAKQAASETARAQVDDEIRAELPSGWLILDESWTVEFDGFETDGEADARQPELAYEGRAVVRVLGYEEEKLEEHLRFALEKRLDEEYVLFPGEISFTKTVDEVDWESASGTIAARVTHTTIPDLSLETLRAKVARRSEAEAREYLEGLPGVRSVSMELWPFWATSIPRIEKRINLDLTPERQP